MEPRRHHRYNENKGIPFNQSCREDWVNGPPRTFARVAKCIAPPLERQSVGLWPTAKTLEAIQCICTVAVRVKCKKCSQISEIIADGVQHSGPNVKWQPTSIASFSVTVSASIAIFSVRYWSRLCAQCSGPALQARTKTNHIRVILAPTDTVYQSIAARLSLSFSCPFKWTISHHACDFLDHETSMPST